MFLRVVCNPCFGPLKALCVQGFWSKRVADTEEDKDSLRFFREELMGQLGCFFSELFRHQDLLVLFFGENNSETE